MDLALCVRMLTICLLLCIKFAIVALARTWVLRVVVAWVIVIARCVLLTRVLRQWTVFVTLLALRLGVTVPVRSCARSPGCGTVLLHVLIWSSRLQRRIFDVMHGCLYR